MVFKVYQLINFYNLSNMEIQDNTRIKSIKSIYSDLDLFKDNAEDSLILLFQTIKDKKNELSDLRMKAQSLEEEINKLQSIWSKFSVLFDVEFETINIKEINNKVCLNINSETGVKN